MKKIICLAIMMLLSGCAEMAMDKSDKIALQKQREKEAVLRKNVILPYYEFFSLVRNTCKVDTQEPKISLFKESFDNDLITPLEPSLNGDKANLKKLLTFLKEEKCSIDKSSFVSLGKKLKCFMAKMQETCMFYNHDKENFKNQPLDKEDTFFSNLASQENFICNKNWDESRIYPDYCPELEPDGVNLFE